MAIKETHTFSLLKNSRYDHTSHKSHYKVHKVTPIRTHNSELKQIAPQT